MTSCSKYMNIVMASDSNWEPMYIAVKSIIDSSEKETRIHFHFLISDSFTMEIESIFLEMAKNYKASFYRVEHELEGYNVESNISWIGFSTYYRLIIPDVLRQEEKCLYLDTDTLICTDLRTLYEEDLSDYLIAGVHALAFHTDDMAHVKKIGIDSNDQYINAGVILMNLKKMRAEKITAQMKERIIYRYPLQDQDIINISCYGKIKKLPFKYNAMIKYYGRDLSMFNTCYSKEEINNAWIKPAIIHYAGADKPWTSVDCPLAESWWRICYGSIVEGFYAEKIKKALYYYLLYERKEKNYEEWIINVYSKLNCASVIALYGAGKVAKQCLDEMTAFGITPRFIVITEKSDDDMFYGIPVISIDEISIIPKDAPIVIGVSRPYVTEIIELLENKGRSSSLILLRNEKLGFYEKV